MLYLVALILPPLALFLCGKLVQGILNLLLCCTLYGIPLAAIWAIIAVANHKAEKRTDRLIRAMKK